MPVETPVRRRRRVRHRPRLIPCLLALVAVLLVIKWIDPFAPRERPLPETPDWITVELLPLNEFSRPGTPLEEVNGIVIHYVGNPGTTAAQNHSFFTNLAQTGEEDYRGTGISLPRPSKEDVTYRVSDMSRIFFGVVSPLHINRSPGKPRTECGKYQIIAFLQFFLKIPDAERKRTGTGIAITFDVDHHFLGRYFEPLRHSGNDTLVSLMRNHPVNLFLSQMVSGNNSFTGIRHIRYGILEYRAAFLINIMQMMIQ